MPAPLNDQPIDKMQKGGAIFTLTLQKYLYFRSTHTHTHTFWFLSSNKKMFWSISVRFSPAKSRISCKKTTSMHLRCKTREGGWRRLRLAQASLNDISLQLETLSPTPDIQKYLTAYLKLLHDFVLLLWTMQV